MEQKDTNEPMYTLKEVQEISQESVNQISNSFKKALLFRTFAAAFAGAPITLLLWSAKVPVPSIVGAAVVTFFFFTLDYSINTLKTYIDNKKKAMENDHNNSNNSNKID